MGEVMTIKVYQDEDGWRWAVTHPARRSKSFPDTTGTVTHGGTAASEREARERVGLHLSGRWLFVSKPPHRAGFHLVPHDVDGHEWLDRMQIEEWGYGPGLRTR